MGDRARCTVARVPHFATGGPDGDAGNPRSAGRHSTLALAHIRGQFGRVSKSERIGHLRVEGEDGLDPHYAGWFACFNRGEYYEAHDVLEALWLVDRRGPDGNFYKGLIQLAGAFVHLQKDRLGPAESLFRLAEGNLQAYGDQYRRLDLGKVRALIADWRRALAATNPPGNPLRWRPRPQILPEGAAGRAPGGVPGGAPEP